MQTGPNPPPGRWPACLGILTHNVRGMQADTPVKQARLHALMHLWVELRVGIVCVQETWLGPENIAETEAHMQGAARELRMSPFKAFWACNRAGRGGVGILIRTDLLAGGRIRLSSQQSHIHAAADGRMLSLKMHWGHHAFTLANVYLPSGDSSGQRDFIAHRLHPLYEQTKGNLVVVGDFNYTENFTLDRLHPPGSHADRMTAACMLKHCPSLTCAFRAKHPTSRCFTYLSGRSASRIDRICVPTSMVKHVEQCHPVANTLSDHRPVVMRLRAAGPETVGRGLPRTRMYFTKDAGLKTTFAEWLLVQSELAPTDHHALLLWWATFKGDVAAKASALNAESAAIHQAHSAAAAAAKAALAGALEAVDAGGACGDATLAAVASARRRLADVWRRDAEAPALATRQEWLHTGERPCPLITQLTRPPQAARHIAALRSPSGGLVVGRQLPAMVAQYFGSVSAAPATNAAAAAEVLHALCDANLCVPEVASAALGSPVIEAEELRTAMKHTKSGRSPGPDGIPAELYRVFGDTLLPLLAKVFTAIGETGTVPPGFLDGALIVLFKKGDITLAVNYRPITLLNTDYRLLAKTLATRLNPVLCQIITPEQTAYLDGRSIGDNIMFLQLLPALLRDEGRSAVIAFLDFYKAYDTIDRAFLLKAMEAMSIGAGFMKWTRTLLTNTNAVAVVNGFVSAPVAFVAGVRQGCPLSPLLYLFVAQALQCFMRAKQVGIQIGDTLRSLSQYADDGNQLLPELTEPCVQSFLMHMGTFERASGQRLNTSKCELLPVGIPMPGPLPTTVAGIPVVMAAGGLGLTHTNIGAVGGAADVVVMEPKGDWPARVAGMKRCYSKCAKLFLSTFGRGFASSGYGISKLLYHAEFEDMPEGAAAEIDAATKKLVDRGLAPEATTTKLPGIPSALLPGHPRTGGFGCLPWRQHVKGRHAMWATKLIKALADGIDASSSLWLVTVHVLLTRLGKPTPQQHLPCVHPALALLAAARNPLTFHVAACARGLPMGPLRRMALGLRALHPDGGIPLDVHGQPLELGPWCCSAPIWTNPLLPAPEQPSGVGGPGSCMEDVFGDLQVIPSLQTVGDACRIYNALAAAMADCSQRGLFGDARSRVCDASTWHPELQRAGLALMPGHMRTLVEDRGAALALVTQLHDAIPVAWRDLCMHTSAAAIALAAPSAVSVVVGRLGWRLPVPPPAAPGAEGGGTLLTGLSVRMATALQLGGIMEARHAAHETYVRVATGEEEVSPGAVASFVSTLGDAWQLKWENGQKEALWRLAVDGVNSVTSRTARSWSCPCCPAIAQEPRLHCFWHCPVAEAVTQEILTSMPANCPPLARASVWLCRFASEAIHPGVWLVVCMAALSAMEHGRRQLWRLHWLAHDAGPPGAVQLTLVQAWEQERPAPGPSVLARACALAVADFWSRLCSFAALNLAPDSWLGVVNEHHPFLCHGGRAVRRRGFTFFEDEEPEASGATQGGSLPAPLAAGPSCAPPAPMASLRQLTLEEAWERAEGLARD